METRKGVGRETDTTREIETETGSVTQTAQKIETGVLAATETESTRRRGGDGDKARGADDGAAGAAGGGDIRGVQLAECCKHAVGYLLLLHTV